MLSSGLKTNIKMPDPFDKAINIAISNRNLIFRTEKVRGDLDHILYVFRTNIFVEGVERLPFENKLILGMSSRLPN